MSPVAPRPAVAARRSWQRELLLPALSKEVQAYGGPEPQLEVVEGAMPVVGTPCWMVQGRLPGERRFWLCFCAKDINAAKTVALAEGDASPSLLESFLIDERKTTLDRKSTRLNSSDRT